MPDTACKKEGETAVHLAAELTPTDVHYELEDSDIIRLLLEFGGDVNIPTKLVWGTHFFSVGAFLEMTYTVSSGTLNLCSLTHSLPFSSVLQLLIQICVLSCVCFMPKFSHFWTVVIEGTKLSGLEMLLQTTARHRQKCKFTFYNKTGHTSHSSV